MTSQGQISDIMANNMYNIIRPLCATDEEATRCAWIALDLIINCNIPADTLIQHGELIKKFVNNMQQPPLTYISILYGAHNDTKVLADLINNQ